MIETAAFAVVAFMLTAYVVLDGYDLGVAAIAPLIARNDRERAAVMRCIGPFWNGNEVWLIAAGAALFAIFPSAYASAFSGFYLPFMLVLWLLMFRGIALELRDHLESDLWHVFWDAAFWLAGVLLIAIFGVALGNLIRGVPLDAKGYFQGTFGFLLNPYALLVACFALATIAQHGAAFAALRIDGAPAARAMRMMDRWWWAVLLLYAATSFATFGVRNLAGHAWTLVFPLLALASLLGQRMALARKRPAAAFAWSTAFVATLLGAAAATLYPYLLTAFPATRGGLSIYEAAPSPGGLAAGLGIAIAGSAGALIYGSIVWRRMAGRVPVE